MSNLIQKSQPPQVLVDQIIGLYNQGQLERAVSLAESLAEQYPNALILYDILGAAYMGLKNTDKTIESYQKALRLSSNHTDAYNNMGMALYDQGKFDVAVESYKKVVKLEPKFADAHYNLGNALKQMGELKQAVESYKASLAINPNDAEVLLNYGNVLKDYGEFDQSIKAYKNALKINPSSSAAQTNMDNAIKEKVEIDKNVADYARIAKLEISSAEVFSFFGAVLKTKGYLDAAIDSYKQALKINPDYVETVKSDYAEAYYFQGVSLHTRGNRKAAIASYHQAIQIKPDYFLAYLNIGVDQQLVGNLDAAIDSYKQAIRIKPDYAEAYYNMGLAQMKKGDLDKALRSYERALKIKSNYAKCYLTYETIQVQFSDASAVGNQLKSFDNEGLKALLCKNPKHQIIQSINHFLQCDIEASEGNLQNYKKLVEARQSEDLSEKDQLFCIAYASFINHLIKKCPIHTSFNNNKIYHIGESHCLSYAHHHLTTGTETFCIFPKITFGAKSYHFSKPEGNFFKSITQQNLNSIPYNSLVLISFGEIDCRINEGLISASKKTGMQLAALVEKTVIGYLKWFLNANLINKHKYKFFNVPAPVYNKNFPLSANQDAAKVVCLFNETLEKNIGEYSFGLIDVYRPTRAENSFSNSLYHCDGYHLDSCILGVIGRQIVK